VAVEYLNAALEDAGYGMVTNASRDVIEKLALPVQVEDAETLCRLKDYFGNASLRLTVIAVVMTWLDNWLKVADVAMTTSYELGCL